MDLYLSGKSFIVCQVIAGEKIQPVARKHGVSRPSVYASTWKALDIESNSPKTGKTRT